MTTKEKPQLLNKEAYSQAVDMVTELEAFKEYDSETQADMLLIMTNGLMFYLDAISAIVSAGKELNKYPH